MKTIFKSIAAIACISMIACNFPCQQAVAQALAGADIKSYDIAFQGPDGDKNYMAYSRLVREKIKERLEGAYIDYFKEGDVKAFFTLKYDGSLVELKTAPDSTKDLRLTDIVTACIKKASPFPRFPAALTLPEASFCIIISFKGSRR